MVGPPRTVYSTMAWTVWGRGTIHSARDSRGGGGGTTYFMTGHTTIILIIMMMIQSKTNASKCTVLHRTMALGHRVTVDSVS